MTDKTIIGIGIGGALIIAGFVSIMTYFVANREAEKRVKLQNEIELLTRDSELIKQEQKELMNKTKLELYEKLCTSPQVINLSTKITTVQTIDYAHSELPLSENWSEKLSPTSQCIEDMFSVTYIQTEDRGESSLFVCVDCNYVAHGQANVIYRQLKPKGVTLSDLLKLQQIDKTPIEDKTIEAEGIVEKISYDL
ncbi:hypothetical protein HOK51_04180 [Candidatus Woesearchaeota archaeon]|jgi:hypothetical protein|nr:hypothetical protein [Candidatus Woesearchaeota archaeon]MBT6519020.1 hypothetical protein [Candidatus Woesearchaeota archaeon]MBT7368781.1 hypothetical protein [Candidatus Woesearchaeota archaeon]